MYLGSLNSKAKEKKNALIWKKISVNNYKLVMLIFQHKTLERVSENNLEIAAVISNICVKQHWNNNISALSILIVF